MEALAPHHLSISEKTIWEDLKRIRQQRPLIHNITNYVVMNSTANALLAIGASPVMAHAHEEVCEMVQMAKSLVINIGTISEYWLQSMLSALKEAYIHQVPVILDPVGAGATLMRTEAAKQILDQAKLFLIRGNASEIVALQNVIQKAPKYSSRTKGVDAEISSLDAIPAAKELSLCHGCTVAVSGEVDIIVHGENILKLGNGHELMSKVTGLGCTSSALMGAFAAVNRSSYQAAAHGAAMMGICGQLAAEKSSGPGSLQVHLLDRLYLISEEEISQYLRIIRE